MKLIRSALGDHQDFAAVDVSVLGAGVACDYSHFLNSVRSRVVARQVVHGLVDLDAIENIVVGLGTVAIERGATSRACVALVAVAGCHARHAGVDRASYI